jgi:3,4-dihydroxy 2-butanone 4-phosphate synthase/GTP cyclohydrolase II
MGSQTRWQPNLPMTSAAGPIEPAVERLKAADLIVVVEGEGRHCYGSVVVGAQHATAGAINFMARHARGLVCLALTPKRCDELELTPMSRRQLIDVQTGFTVSIEARDGVTTGISAQDRAQTIKVAIDPESRAFDLVRPGHIFPIRTQPGGVLDRRGHPEAALDLVLTAGLEPAAVLCEILDEDGSVAGRPALELFAAKHGLVLVHLDDLVTYRHLNEVLVKRGATALLPTQHGPFRIVGYRDLIDGTENVALLKGNVSGAADVLVGVHRQCIVGEAFGGLRCDCGERLAALLQRIDRTGCGVVIYLGRDGAHPHLLDSVDTYEWRDEIGFGDGTAETDQLIDNRSMMISAQILRDLGLSSICLAERGTAMADYLEAHGIAVVEHLEAGPTED